MDFRAKHVHFIGIGGISMSALARILETQGAIITGSDSAIGGGHDAQNITIEHDFVIINGAIGDDNPELCRARMLNIPIIGRDELLAQIEGQFKHRIAVAGCHGKSTTTAMIAHVLIAGGLNPTVHNGAKFTAPDGTFDNLVLGSGDIFITEACEFKRSFLKLSPTVAVITNIDADHLDCYKNIDEIRAAFNQFTERAKTVISHDGNRGVNQPCNSILPREISLSIPGRHNILNALLAAQVGEHFGVPRKTILRALKNFRGIERRFETVGTRKGAKIIVDFAHHPTEIETTIATAADIFAKPKSKTDARKPFLIVFQPHTYTRTIALFDDFCRVLQTADCVLYKTYSAREKPIEGGSVEYDVRHKNIVGSTLVVGGRVVKRGSEAVDIARAVNAPYFDDAETLKKFLEKKFTKYRAIILTGAGDIYKILCG